MSLTGQIARNTAVQITGKGLSLVATVATIALMTRTLGAAGFGYYTTAFALLQVAFILVDFGLQMTTVTLIADPRRDPAVTLGNVLGLRISTALAMAAVAGGGIWISGYPVLVKQAVSLLTLAFSAAHVTAVLTAVFQQKISMGKAAAAEVAGKLATLLCVVVCAAAGLGLNAMVVATVLGAGLQALLLYVWANRLLQFSWRADFKIWGEIMTATWPLAVTIALNLVYFKMDTVILAAYRSPQEVGWYGAPYRVLELCINLGYLFLGLLLPLLAHAAATGNRVRFSVILQRGFDAMAVAGLPLVVGGAILAEPLMVLVAGPEFANSGPLLSILLVATAIILISAVFGYGVVALGKQRTLIPYYAGNAALAITAYLWAIPKYGAPAAAWLTVGSELIILAVSALVTYRQIQFLPNLRIAGIAALAATMMGVILWWLPAWPVLGRIAIGGGIYLITLRLLGGLPSELLRQIMRSEAGNKTGSQ
ncbi:MAG: flippase [Patescibacteria group bacterium]|nr:flippase [Patescibacteria group bacterium]